MVDLLTMAWTTSLALFVAYIAGTVFVYLKRRTTAMRILGVATSADLLFGLELGLGLVIATAVQPYTYSGCLAQIWCGHLGYTVVFDMYAAYCYQILYIFEAASLRLSRSPALFTSRAKAASILFVVLYLALWSGVDAPTPQSVFLDGTSYVICASRSVWWSNILLIWHGIRAGVVWVYSAKLLWCTSRLPAIVKPVVGIVFMMVTAASLFVILIKSSEDTPDRTAWKQAYGALLVDLLVGAASYGLRVRSVYKEQAQRRIQRQQQAAAAQAAMVPLPTLPAGAAGAVGGGGQAAMIGVGPHAGAGTANGPAAAEAAVLAAVAAAAAAAANPNGAPGGVALSGTAGSTANGSAANGTAGAVLGANGVVLVPHSVASSGAAGSGGAIALTIGGSATGGGATTTLAGGAAPAPTTGGNTIPAGPGAAPIVAVPLDPDEAAALDEQQNMSALGQALADPTTEPMYRGDTDDDDDLDDDDDDDDGYRIRRGRGRRVTRTRPPGAGGGEFGSIAMNAAPSATSGTISQFLGTSTVGRPGAAPITMISTMAGGAPSSDGSSSNGSAIGAPHSVVQSVVQSPPQQQPQPPFPAASYPPLHAAQVHPYLLPQPQLPPVASASTSSPAVVTPPTVSPASSSPPALVANAAVVITALPPPPGSHTLPTASFSTPSTPAATSSAVTVTTVGPALVASSSSPQLSIPSGGAAAVYISTSSSSAAGVGANATATAHTHRSDSNSTASPSPSPLLPSQPQYSQPYSASSASASASASLDHSNHNPPPQSLLTSLSSGEAVLSATTASSLPTPDRVSPLPTSAPPVTSARAISVGDVGIEVVADGTTEVAADNKPAD